MGAFFSGDIAQDATLVAMSQKLPAALVGGRLDVNVGASVPLDVEDRAARLLGHVTVDSLPEVTATIDPASSLNVSDRAARLLGHVTVDNATLTTDVEDRAARLLGHVSVDSLPAAVNADGGLLAHVTNWPASQHITVDNPTDVSALAKDVTAAAIRDRLPVGLNADGGLDVHVLNETAATDVSALATEATLAAMSQKLPAALVGGRLDVNVGASTTVPISAAALPLPAGAAQEHATAANPGSVRLTDGASYLGTTAGRLQVADGGVALKVDGSATTQPVSVAGTVSVAQAAAVDVSDRAARLLGHVTVDALPSIPAGASVIGAVAQSGAPWGVAGTVTPSDLFVNPTTAQATFALGGVFDGLTWDRLASAPGASTGVLSAAGDSRVLSGSGAALNATPVSADLRGYRWVSVTCSTDATWNAQFVFESSNDGAVWTPQSLSQSSATGPQTASGSFGPNQNITYHGALAGRYFRVRVTPYTAGTLTVNGVASAFPGAFEALNATISPGSAVSANADTNSGANLFPIGNWIFNGVTWERSRSAASAQGTTGLGIAAAASMGFDGTNYRAVNVDTSGRQTVVGIGAAGSDGTGSVTNWIPMPVHIYTGSGTWDRMRTASGAAATTGTGLLGVGALGFDGTSYQRVTMASTPGDATTGSGILAVGGWLHNGATFDRQRSNTNITALASGARTATTASADQVNYNGDGIIVALNVTAASGTGGLQVVVEGKETIGNTYFQINATPVAVTATGTTVYEIDPGIGVAGGGVTQRTSASVPRDFRVRVIHGDASSYTYSCQVKTVVA